MPVYKNRYGEYKCIPNKWVDEVERGGSLYQDKYGRYRHIPSNAMDEIKEHLKPAYSTELDKSGKAVTYTSSNSSYIDKKGNFVSSGDSIDKEGNKVDL